MPPHFNRGGILMHYFDGKSGFVSVITGPMFSEKSGELIKRCKKLEKYGHKKLIAFKPSIDVRFSKTEIVSRIGLTLKAISVEKDIDDVLYKEIMDKAKLCDVIAFDEAQFFNHKIVDITKELAYRGKMVFLAGLNLDYRGEPFGYMGDLMAMADELVLLTVMCACCGRPAIFTQRLINGKPAKQGPVELVGDTEVYEPRCRLCFVPPEKA